jgi:two-component system, sensor histidine kinase and response regulator
MAVATKDGQPFVLVLLDCNMPDLDGFQVAEQIALRPELAGSTIMMLSSSGQHIETARCRELGVSAYLTKPIHAADLHAAICRVMSPKTQPPVAVRPSTSPLARHTVRPLRVLLAEDNVVNQRVAVGLMNRRGHTVTVANTGLEALVALDREEFDIVLMDVQMPEMGGFDATAAIRKREQGTERHVRIIAMTAHALHGDRERCLAAGMDGYLSKPIDLNLLNAILEQAPQSSGTQMHPDRSTSSAIPAVRHPNTEAISAHSPAEACRPDVRDDEHRAAALPGRE